MVSAALANLSLSEFSSGFGGDRTRANVWPRSSLTRMTPSRTSSGIAFFPFWYLVCSRHLESGRYNLRRCSGSFSEARPYAPARLH